MSTSGGRNKEALEALRARVAAESEEGRQLVADIRNNPVCSVSIDDSVPCLAVTWKRYVTSTQIRFIHEMMIQMLKDDGVTKILGDDTALPVVHTDDQEWIVEDWMPRAVAAGLKAGASRPPSAYFGRLAVGRIRSRAPKELPIRLFDSLDEARHWLRSQGD